MAGYLIEWIERLKREAVEARGLLGNTVSAEKLLPTRIYEWWHALPDVERKDRYVMDEFIALFGDSPARIGVVLAGLGWRRGRRWTGDTYSRYWKPPCAP